MRADALILVVDDDADVRDSTQFLLESWGYAVATAENGEAALRRLKHGLQPDLILLDLAMPVKDGFAFRREQLEEPALASIPVVVFSAHHDLLEHRRAALHPAACLPKPLDIEVLRGVLRNV